MYPFQQWFLVAGLMAGAAAQAEVNITGLANSCNNCDGANGVSTGQSMSSHWRVLVCSLIPDGSNVIVILKEETDR